jgi:hypothetical protein
MGITQIIDPFYRKLDSRTHRSKFENGQIAWVPTSFDIGLPTIMEVERSSPEDHFASKFSIHPMTDKDFRKHSRLPIKLLNLGETEELLVSRCKLRPAIVLTPSLGRYPDLSVQLRRMGKTHYEDHSVVVIPLYSIQKDDQDTGFPAVMVARTKALLYNQFFFCPRKNSGLLYDSIARLDRLFFLRPISPAFQPTEYALSDDCLLVLTVMLRSLLGLCMPPKEEETFLAVRELAMETLPEEARPK